MGYWRTKRSSLGPETMEKIRLSVSWLAEIKESCLEEVSRLLWFGRGKDECFHYIRPEKKFEKHGIWISKNIYIYLTNNLLIRICIQHKRFKNL